MTEGAWRWPLECSVRMLQFWAITALLSFTFTHIAACRGALTSPSRVPRAISLGTRFITQEVIFSFSDNQFTADDTNSYNTLHHYKTLKLWPVIIYPPTLSQYSSCTWRSSTRRSVGPGLPACNFGARSRHAATARGSSYRSPRSPYAIASERVSLHS